MSKKNAILFGDSYSTFLGYNPEGFWHYYSAEDKENEVCSVEQTWWHQYFKETDINLLMNNSWSGSTICYTGWNGVDCSETSSFIYRIETLVKEGFFKQNKIDEVYILGGTNDNWSNAPIGSPKYSDYKKEDLYFVLPAISYFMMKLRETLPQAKIVWIINYNFKEEIRSEMLESAKKFNIITVELNDFEKINGHPNIKGMTEIKDQIINALK